MSNILYIEDDKAIAGLFKAIIEQQGHTVELAHTGADGLAMCAASPYEAIAVDYQLPDMTGIDICRQLLLSDPDTPIVMITGMGDQRLANEALGLGVMNYVQKDTEQVFLELLPSIVVQLLRKGADRKERVRLKAELERSEQRYKTASQMAKMGHWVWDHGEHRMTYVSPELADIFGVTPEEYLSRSSSPEGDWDWYHPDDRENYKEIIQKAYTNKTGYDVTCRIITGKGEIRYVHELSTITLGKDGVFKETVGVTQDVTVLKRAELAASVDREKLDSVITNAVEGIITISTDGIIQSFNKAAETLFGYSPGDVIGKNINTLMPADVAAKHDEYLRRYMETGVARIIGIGREVEGMHKDGTCFPLHLSISQNNLADDITFTGLMHDLTEEQAAQRMIRHQQVRMEDASRIAKMGVWEWSEKEQRVTYMSPEEISFLGYTPETVPDILYTPEGDSLCIHPDDLERYRQVAYGVAESGSDFYDIEYRLVRPDGEIRYSRQAGRVERDSDGVAVTIFGVDQDVTAQKKIEDALRESEERFRDFSEVGNDWHWELDGDLCYVELSPSGSNAALYPSNHYLGQSRAAVKPEGMDDAIWQAHIEDLEAQRPFRNLIQPRQLSGGSSIWLSVSGKPLFAPDGSFRGYRGTAVDVSRQKRNEDALLSAQHLAKVGSWRYVLDQDMITDCSEEIAYLHGYSLAEFLELFGKEGKGYRSLVHSEDVDRHYKTLEDAVANKKNWECEFRIIRKDGVIRHMKEYGMVELNVDGTVNGMTGSLQDITEEKWVAAELEQAREAAEAANRAKSDFLSSMSHELRTPLNAILGFSQLLEYNPQEPLTEAQKSSVDHIKKGGDHLLSLINDILDLARIESGKTDLSIENIPLIENINECMALVQTMADQREIKISIKKQPDEPYIVRADTTRLTQVVLNLLSNAIKYNRRGGRITIDLADTPEPVAKLLFSRVTFFSKQSCADTIRPFAVEIF